MKQKNKKAVIGIFLIVALLFSMVGVFAQGQNKYVKSNSYSENQMKQIQNKFQYKYKLNCTGECTYFQDDKLENLQLEVREQKRILNLFNVETRENYVFNSDNSGEIIKARYNIWSRLLNKNRIRI